MQKAVRQEISLSPTAIIQGSDDAIMSIDLEGIVTSWNAGAERIFGYAASEAIGLPVTIIVPIELRGEEQEIIRRIRQREYVEHWETIGCKKNGSCIDISLTLSPIKNSQGQIIGISKIVRDVSERKLVDDALKESELAGRLLELQDEERKRLARELHDGVGQLLAAIAMNFSELEKEKLSAAAARCVQDNSSLVQQVLSDIRTLSHLLHPPLLDEVGLHSALKGYIDLFTERSKIVTRLEVPSTSERLPQSYELCLFRIAQESLTNVQRHSGSSTALVRLSRSRRDVKLEVIDKGHGMVSPTTRPADPTSGLGLRGMRERLRLLGGKLEIRSTSDGTVVTASLPLENAKSVTGTDRR